MFIIVSCFAYFLALDRVQLQVDGKTLTFRTIKPTVKAVLAERKILLNPGDMVVPDVNTPITENLHIQVTRAFPVFIKTANGKFEYYTVERSVRDVLLSANVAFDEDDRISPGLDQVVKANQEIEVVDVSSKVLTTVVPLKAATEYRRDTNLEKGTQKVIQQGEDGLAERQIKVVYENGREKKRIVIAEKILKPRVNTIIALGIKPIIRVLETSRGSYRYYDVKVMDATAYSPGPESCGVYAKYGRTYTGKKAGFGLVAVDPRVIKLGTKLYIEGYGLAEAADIGAAIKGNRIDLCFETYREAIMFGRKKVKVYILSE
ncbi:MAG TPA: ubiquitin-like domain-containing protein [Bacillota bacterium]|nr:ubiquitin-like domain-containing protein [Bacillota bacterium]